MKVSFLYYNTRETIQSMSWIEVTHLKEICETMRKGQQHPVASRSKNLLVGSLCELMKFGPLDEITIKDITDHAELTRRTFYAHFRSKEEILEYHLAELSKNLIEIITSEKNPTHSWIAKTYFHFWMSHLDLLKNLRENQLLPLLFETFESQIMTIRSIFGCEAAKNSSSYEYYSSAFFTGALWNILDKWIANDVKETPEELTLLIADIASKFSSLFN